MIAHNPKSLCRQAELYYYDFLCDESRGVVPEAVVNHIEQCQHCRQQINRLEAVLLQADAPDSEKRQISSAVTSMLKLHFAYRDKPVTCNIAKPFLPTLLDPTLGIRIPTPIVTHVCDCQQCSEDLDIIRTLDLSRKQLCRLSQLFAEKSAGGNIVCSEAQNAIPLVVSMVFNGIDPETLKHLCACPDCRGLLYQCREMVLRGLLKTTLIKNEFPCDKVSAGDFFDYVVPYGIDLAGNQYAKFRESLTSHLRTCPVCLAKMQQLHNTVYGIIERAESEVVTIYHIDESAKAEATSESGDIYAGFPVRVETANREGIVNAGGAASIIDSGAAPRRKISAVNMKTLVKTAAAAAAIILIAIVLVFNIPAAKAVTIDEIYKAIEKIKNVYIVKFVPGETKPIQEKWVSQALNIYVTKTAEQCVLWDIANGITKVKHPEAGTVKTIQLSAETIADIEKKIGGHLDLMPFYNMSDMPTGTQWNRVIDDSLQAIIKNTEVYDLTWSEKRYGGSVKFLRWRVFVNPATNLPRRTELYTKQAADGKYILESVEVIKYLEKDEMQATVRDIFF